MAPQVTIGVPVYNGEQFLRETLDSALAQHFTDLEVVISDNGSTDGTRALCEAYAAQDSRVRYSRSEINRGLGWNYNRVLEMASAPMFMWLAADDVADPALVGRCVEALEAHPEAVLAFARVQLIDSSSVVIGELGDADLDFTASAARRRIGHFLHRQAVHIVYGMIRTGALREIGGMPQMRGDDFVLGVDLLMVGPFVLVPEQLFRARRHAGQGSQITDVLAQAREHHPGRRVPLAFPQWRMNAEMYRRVALGPLGPADKVGAAAAVARSWTVPAWRTLAADVKRNVRSVASQVRPRQEV